MVADWDAAIARAQPDSWTPERVAAELDRRPDVLHRMIYDIYDAVRAEGERDRGEVRNGRRPRRQPTSMQDVWDTIAPEPYSMDPFPVAMVTLLNGRSQRQFARRIPCHQTTLSRMISGVLEPDLVMLERIAKAAGVMPTYFVEYRAMFVSRAIEGALKSNPSISVTAMRRIGQVR